MNNLARVCGILLEQSKRITVSTRDIEYAVKCIYPMNNKECIGYATNKYNMYITQTDVNEKLNIRHTKHKFVSLMTIYIPRVRIAKGVDVLTYYYIEFFEQYSMCEGIEINQDVLLLHIACEVMNFRCHISLCTKDIHVAMHIMKPELDVEPYNDELIDNVTFINDKKTVESVMKKYRETPHISNTVVMCWKFMLSKIPTVESTNSLSQNLKTLETP